MCVGLVLDWVVWAIPIQKKSDFHAPLAAPHLPEKSVKPIQIQISSNSFFFTLVHADSV